MPAGIRRPRLVYQWIGGIPVYRYTRGGERTASGRGEGATKILGDNLVETTKPAGEEVFQVLRRMILNGELQRGERLVERRLAVALKVSRTPVREALRKLEAEGLLRREAYRGLVVAQFTPEDAEEILKIREVLEGLATQLAATRRTSAQLRSLKSILTKMNAAAEAEEHEAFGRLHRQFHETICLMAGGSRLYTLVQSIGEYLDSFTEIGYKHMGRSQQAREEHTELFARISAGDAAGAEEIARTHIRHSKDALLAVLTQEEQGK